MFALVRAKSERRKAKSAPYQAACTIELRNGYRSRTDPDRNRTAPTGVQAGVAEGARPRGRELSQLEDPGAQAGVAHRLRVGTLPEHWRMLEPPHGDVHAAGKSVYPALRILRGAQRTASAD